MGRLGVALACVALLAAGVSSAAVSPPTGDLDAIAFFKLEADLYAKLPGAKVVETGYFSGLPIGAAVHYAWGSPPAKGYFPQQATVLARLQDGKIVAYLATLTSPKLKKVRILMAGSTVFVSSGRCWNKTSATSSPFGTGDAYLFNDGGVRFSPLVKNGSKTTTTFTYQWAPGAQARETNTFSAGPRPKVVTTIQVTGKQRMSIRKTITPLTTMPKLPIASPPAIPKPKPLCGTS
jgi:hypothetical protein